MKGACLNAGETMFGIKPSTHTHGPGNHNLNLDLYVYDIDLVNCCECGERIDGNISCIFCLFFHSKGHIECMANTAEYNANVSSTNGTSSSNCATYASTSGSDT